MLLWTVEIRMGCALRDKIAQTVNPQFNGNYLLYHLSTAFVSNRTNPLGSRHAKNWGGLRFLARTIVLAKGWGQHSRTPENMGIQDLGSFWTQDHFGIDIARELFWGKVWAPRLTFFFLQ